MISTLVYDGDCAFCTASVRWVRRLHLRVDVVVPWQHADLAGLGLTAAQCQEAVQLVEGSRVTGGHVALGRLLLRSGWWWAPLALLLLVPPTSWVAARVYRVIADNRQRLPGGTAACAAPAEGAPSATGAGLPDSGQPRRTTSTPSASTSGSAQKGSPGAPIGQ